MLEPIYRRGHLLASDCHPPVPCRQTVIFDDSSGGRAAWYVRDCVRVYAWFAFRWEIGNSATFAYYIVNRLVVGTTRRPASRTKLGSLDVGVSNHASFHCWS